MPRSIIERLPNLKMIASTGPFNASIDMAAAEDHGIHVGTTGGTVASTVELTWALILAGCGTWSPKANRCATAVGRPRSVASWPAARSGCWGWAGSASASPASVRPSG